MLGTETTVSLLLKQPLDEGNIDSFSGMWSLLVKVLLLKGRRRVPSLFFGLQERALSFEDHANLSQANEMLVKTLQNACRSLGYERF